MVVGTICWFAALQPGSNPQRLIVRNAFADATCVMDFEGPGNRDFFSVRKGKTWDHFYPGPRNGFVDLRCKANGQDLTSPGHFHLIRGGRAEVTLTQAGEVEVKYVFRDQIEANGGKL